MPKIPKPTFAQHVDKWKGCQLCKLCKGRKQTILARGKLPCDVFFLGEAPGESEDELGKPFWGPAGLLMDDIVARACEEAEIKQADWKFLFSNLLACIPRDETTRKLIEPPDYAVKACSPRVAQLVELANPQLIVCVGNHATAWLDKIIPKRLERGIRACHIIHPAGILRAKQAQKGLMFQRAVVVLATALRELIPF